MKIGNCKTRKAWKQDACRKSHGSVPAGQFSMRAPVPTRERTLGAVTAMIMAAMFGKGNR